MNEMSEFDIWENFEKCKRRIERNQRNIVILKKRFNKLQQVLETVDSNQTVIREMSENLAELEERIRRVEE